MSKQQRQTSAQSNVSISSKLASMAAAANTDKSEGGHSGDSLSMAQLIAEPAKQHTGIKEDMASLIQESMNPLQASVDGLRDTVNSLQGHLTATETLAGNNFDRLFTAEATIKSLQTLNMSLSDRLENLENSSRRANLHVLNIPEGSEDGQDPATFVSGLLKDAMGADVFAKPPELDRAHRALGPEPAEGGPLRPFILCFHRYREKDLGLKWSRQHQVKYK